MLKPSGLCRSEAILARNLIGASPTDEHAVQDDGPWFPPARKFFPSLLRQDKLHQRKLVQTEKLPEKTSQRKLANMLQRARLDIDKNAVQRIESGKRFVTDIELKVIAEVLRVS